MVNYREILRLKSLKYSNTDLASSVHSSRNKVQEALRFSEALHIQWPLEDDVTNLDLEAVLYPESHKKDENRLIPDYPKVHRELAKPGVTLTLLWAEYCAEAIAAGKKPYMSTQFSDGYRRWNRATKATMRITHKPGAGKSVLLRVLNEILLGKENVSNVSWQALNERFKTAELYGKLANIFADLPTKNIDDNGIFKALVGEDFLTVERKNKDPFNFQNYARLLFSCNEIPKNFGDRSEGFYRRLIIIRFPHAVPKEKRDPMLLEKFRAEADGIFRFALDGLIRLMNQNWRFSETKSNIEERQRYREESNSALSFVAECCELGEGFEVGRTEFYSSYQMFCKDSGLSPFSQTRFNKEIEIAYPGVMRAKDKTGRRKTWRGIRYVDDAD